MHLCVYLCLPCQVLEQGCFFLLLAHGVIASKVAFAPLNLAIAMGGSACSQG